ncbi:uncharacterized protein LOC127868053 [Dreissena polymorpha]|uniref:BD-FAE-like domain-containing protein n=1 Tax=Dreissena polymorpha TaxID=45954 RepID=A0A9D4RKI7_DREPO|nr:uncharacterized protein LOC127868053 [Dreissena polymorpha]XP_052265592.1 uncharacterized protein LOC127868053 [Dreissena polymorpha]XP_052265593.1 uncharacterized protein LOC127868053 [Dreissena polymorpha]KAH3869565.1 hypothetical protein DPMN_032734 [Dreissena polymorpha]
MVGKSTVIAVVAATSIVAFPYMTALICNLAYGWPQIKNKYRRAFSPKKVFALNFSVIQKLVTTLRFTTWYLQSKSFYSNAPASTIMKDRLFSRNGQRLDLYFPRQQGLGDKGMLPIIVFVYGGTWSSGHRSMYGTLCFELANTIGCIVCCPDYTLYPEGHIDNMIKDLRDCLSWLHVNVEHYNGDKQKILLMGHSSGAHICAMTILDLLHDQASEGESAQLQGSTSAGPEMLFIEKHFNGSSDNKDNGSSDNKDNGSSDKGSKTSLEPSASYLLLDSQLSINSDLGDNDRPSSLSSSGKFEMLEKSTSDASMLESEIRALTQAEGGSIMYEGRSQEGVENAGVSNIQITETMVASETEEDDNDSVITVTYLEGQLESPNLADAELASCIKAFIGLAGVYHIGDHFKHEMSRGVEDVSMMARAMRGDTNFDMFSPTCILRRMETPLDFPKTVLIHGTDDYVVPLSSSSLLAAELKRLGVVETVRIIPSCDHYEVALDLSTPSRKFHKTIMDIVNDTAKSVFS